MRVALDATYSVDRHPSGIAVYSGEILAGLAKQHPEDFFLHCYRPKQFRNSPRPDRKNVRRRILIPPLLTFKADVFHALNQRLDKRPAKGVVSTFHDLFVMTGEYSTPEFRARFSQQARRAAENSDIIIAVSAFTASQVSSLLNIPRARIRVISHGVNMPAVNMPSDSEAGRRENLLLCVGALQVRKNLTRLVQAFEQLPRDWTLVLAGAAGGFGVEQILQRIELSPARDRIQVTGYVSRAKLNELYSRASIFAFPSLDEGFGIPVLEAMAHGVPVVTSNRSALVEAAGSAALLVDPRATCEIEAAIRSLIENPGLRQQLAELGRARAALFPWERAVRETYEVYKELRN